MKNTILIASLIALSFLPALAQNPSQRRERDDTPRRGNNAPRDNVPRDNVPRRPRAPEESLNLNTLPEQNVKSIFNATIAKSYRVHINKGTLIPQRDYRIGDNGEWIETKATLERSLVTDSRTITWTDFTNALKRGEKFQCLRPVTQKCNACNGTGIRTRTDRRERTQTIKCPACDGKKEVTRTVLYTLFTI